MPSWSPTPHGFIICSGEVLIEITMAHPSAPGRFCVNCPQLGMDGYPMEPLDPGCAQTFAIQIVKDRAKQVHTDAMLLPS